MRQMLEVLLNGSITGLEIAAVVVITFGGARAFWYWAGSVVGRRCRAIRPPLTDAMGIGLEFAMAAEILRTLLSHAVADLITLGAVILLRALLALLLHFELRAQAKHDAAEQR